MLQTFTKELLHKVRYQLLESRNWKICIGFLVNKNNDQCKKVWIWYTVYLLNLKGNLNLNFQWLIDQVIYDAFSFVHTSKIFWRVLKKHKNLARCIFYNISSQCVKSDWIPEVLFALLESWQNTLTSEPQRAFTASILPLVEKDPLKILFNA